MYSSIDSFINRKIVVLREHDSALVAARAMCDNQVGCVVVYNKDSELVGVLTDRDITCNLISEELDAYIEIKKIMETDVVTLPDSGTISEAIQIMKSYGIRRVPIINETKRHQKKCVGIVTLDDLIAGQFINSLDLSEIVKSQIRRRKVFEAISSKHNGSHLQTYNRFIGQFTEAFQLSKKQTEEIVMYLLGILVQRLHYTGGTHFISQLPKHIQEPLFDLPAGPNRSITDQTILQGVKLRSGLNKGASEVLIQTFWKTLKSVLGEGETTHVLHQLPTEIIRLLAPEESEYFAYRSHSQPISPPPMEKL